MHVNHSFFGHAMAPQTYSQRGMYLRKVHYGCLLIQRWLALKTEPVSKHNVQALLNITATAFEKTMGVEDAE